MLNTPSLILFLATDIAGYLFMHEVLWQHKLVPLFHVALMMYILSNIKSPEIARRVYLFSAPSKQLFRTANSLEHVTGIDWDERNKRFLVGSLHK